MAVSKSDQSVCLPQAGRLGQQARKCAIPDNSKLIGRCDDVIHKQAFRETMQGSVLFQIIVSLLADV